MKKELEHITASWLKNKMDEYNLSVSEISKIVLLDKQRISSWKNENKPMSKNVKSIFHVLFMFEEFKKNIKIISADNEEVIE